jgi:hypothetical protein
MTTVAYFDLAHGISGDMTLACLAHAGRRLAVDVEGAIAEAISSLGLGCAVSFVDDERGGVACLRAEVKTDDRAHDAAALRDAIDRSDVAADVRAAAHRGLDALVRAEATVHGTDPDDVLLHELGSADTAADLIGAASGLATLGVEAVSAAPVPVSRGWFGSAHGPLPAPAPVTLELMAGMRVRGVDEDGELVTPTGAAILSAHDASFGPAPELELAAIGVGAGARRTDVPNICRVLIGASDGSHVGAPSGHVVLLETNIDDQSPQGIAHALEMVLRNGALDAWVTPIVMKKSRPAFALSVLVTPRDEAAVVRTLFVETTTLGVRRRDTTRWALEREEIHVAIRGGTVRVKVARLDGNVVNVGPEFEDCVSIAEHSGISLKDIQAEAVEAAGRALALH